MRISLATMARRHLARPMGGLALVLAWAAPAPAQLTTTEDPARSLALPGEVPDALVDQALLRFGPFFLQPAIALRDMGIDTNVRNERYQPQQDFTLTIVPELSGGFRAGPVRLRLVDTVEYVWYRELSSERSLNGSLSGQFEVRWNRIRPFATGRALRTRARQGNEIDTRAERSEPQWGVGVDLGLASRTWLTLEYQAGETRYDEGETYLGVPLDQALNRRTQASAAGLRFQLTPLTRLTFTGRFEQVRFDTSTFRDNDNYSISASFAFDPEALLAGSATLGYRTLQPDTGGTPGFSGVTANVGVTYTGLPSTRVGAVVTRDVQYSYENAYAYYVDTSVLASLTQRVAGGLELVARARWAWLDYLARAALATDRQDRVQAAGGGVGYRLGDASRLGFDVEWIDRTSPEPVHEYSGVRVFGSVTYGF